MKKNYFILVILVIFTGCSSTYKISDYSSKDKFYDDFNIFACNKIVEVKLRSGRPLYLGNVMIKNDSLFCNSLYTSAFHDTAAMDNIKEIHFTSISHESGEIITKEGRIINAGNIRIKADSVYFVAINKLAALNFISEVNNLKEISYSDTWKYTLPAAAIGTIAGFIVCSTGAVKIINRENQYHNGYKEQYGEEYYICGLSGFLIGSIAGMFIYKDYVYEFEP